MKLRIDEIREKGKSLSSQMAADEFPALKAIQAAGECFFPAPINAELTVLREYDHIRANGKVSTVLRLTCSRCLSEYDLPLESLFTVFYTKAAKAPQDEEVELAEEDLVSVSYKGDEIDFLPEIESQIVTEIPFKPVCSEACKGLCPVCGADMNVAACGCDRSEFNLKFSALKDFKAEK